MNAEVGSGKSEVTTELPTSNIRHQTSECGIVSYGAYIPRHRIAVHEIAKVWNEDAQAMSKGLNVVEKSVPEPDEDTATISVTAARNALARCAISPKDVGAVYVGSESHPYAVKPTATIVAEAIGATPNLTAADLEFACKAGTAGMQMCMGLVQSGMVKYGIAIGADTSQSAPKDPLEYTASAGGAAFIIGTDNIIARINKTLSFTTDTPDFWRREGETYPRHGGRFTGEPAYFRHITSCAKMLFEAVGTKPSDYDYAVFHQPNGSFPLKVGKMLGFTPEQIKQGLVVPYIGNTYSGAVPIGLSSILDVAKPGERIFVVSYGSGAGSDGFDITVTDGIEKLNRKAAPSVADYVGRKKNVDYATYAKMCGKIRMEG
ncbi:MAG: hydroxymethylglutaryl-CoA synthase [Thermoplasmata archaeon HGW-Thermoplasmata-2]|nr:MAG: hydroxymethylglutaryl-CoA synthase [Thermoplasmata archaeon HGW-Thermoplasmata-2]